MINVNKPLATETSEAVYEKNKLYILNTDTLKMSDTNNPTIPGKPISNNI